MASCDNTVLTGQEGLIQFKPLGTTNCIDDYCPFMGDRIYLPCSADYDIGDCLEVETVKIPAGEGQSADGGTSVIGEGDTFYIVDDGKGVAGDVDACGNDMEGVPYIVVSATEGGTPNHLGQQRLAGDEVRKRLSRHWNVYRRFHPRHRLQRRQRWNTDWRIEIISNSGGRGAVATLTVGAGGAILSFEVTKRR